MALWDGGILQCAGSAVLLHMDDLVSKRSTRFSVTCHHVYQNLLTAEPDGQIGVYSIVEQHFRPVSLCAVSSGSPNLVVVECNHEFVDCGGCKVTCAPLLVGDKVGMCSCMVCSKATCLSLLCVFMCSCVMLCVLMWCYGCPCL